MSRRARSRLDKREEALRLARSMGHGTPMPDSDDSPEEPEDWDGHGPDPLGRTPVGPVDVAPAHPESRA